MGRQAYEEWRPSAGSADVVEKANAVLLEYKALGIILTIRQLYYQFVSRDWLANTERNYKRLIGIMANARLAGLVDWDAIEDRTRGLDALTTWSTPQEMITNHAANYRRDLWATQDTRIEVWIEKEALASVFQTVCRQLRVDFMCCRGYMSLSEVRASGIRMLLRRRGQSIYGDKHAKQRNVVLHFGDHDPSGLDMTRNIEERLIQLSQGPVKLIRVALNMNQVEQYDPPPNPAKTTDSRYEAYSALHGSESWELDALDPTVLRDLVTGQVLGYRDDDLWQVELAQERRERALLKAVADTWETATSAVSEEVDVEDYVRRESGESDEEDDDASQ